MKAARGLFPGAADQPDPKVRCYLFHGANEAASRAMAARLLKGLGAEKQTFTGAMLKTDPGALLAEAGAISMFGGRNLLWVEPAGDEAAEAVQAVLDAPATDHPVVVIAGVLKKTSALLKLAEAHPRALSQQFFALEGRNAAQLVAELGRDQGLRVPPPLAMEIALSAGNDQAIIAQELAKFALYLQATPDSPRDLDEEVVELLGADAAEVDASDAIEAALSGDVRRLADELQRLEASGVDAIPTLRNLQRKLLMLAGLRARIDEGQRSDAVLATVWRRDQALAAKSLPRWTSAMMAQAIDRVAAVERNLLLTGAPDKAALGEELVTLSRSATRR